MEGGGGGSREREKERERIREREVGKILLISSCPRFPFLQMATAPLKLSHTAICVFATFFKKISFLMQE